MQGNEESIGNGGDEPRGQQETEKPRDGDQVIAATPKDKEMQGNEESIGNGGDEPRGQQETEKPRDGDQVIAATPKDKEMQGNEESIGNGGDEPSEQQETEKPRDGHQLGITDGTSVADGASVTDGVSVTDEASVTDGAFVTDGASTEPVVILSSKTSNSDESERKHQERKDKTDDLGTEHLKSEVISTNSKETEERRQKEEIQFQKELKDQNYINDFGTATDEKTTSSARGTDLNLSKSLPRDQMKSKQSASNQGRDDGTHGGKAVEKAAPLRSIFDPYFSDSIESKLEDLNQENEITPEPKVTKEAENSTTPIRLLPKSTEEVLDGDQQSSVMTTDERKEKFHDETAVAVPQPVKKTVTQVPEVRENNQTLVNESDQSGENLNNQSDETLEDQSCHVTSTAEAAQSTSAASTVDNDQSDENDTCCISRKKKKIKKNKNRKNDPTSHGDDSSQIKHDDKISKSSKCCVLL